MKKLGWLFLFLLLLVFVVVFGEAKASEADNYWNCNLSTGSGSSTYSWCPDSATYPLPVMPYGAPSVWVRGTGVATASTAATTVIAAPTSGKLYIVSMQCFRTDAGTTASYVTLDDTVSSIIGLANSGGGGGNDPSFGTPLVVAAGSPLTFTSSTSLSSVYCNAQGYNAP